MEEKVYAELQRCETIAEMFTVLQKNYVLEHSRPGALVKSMVINGLKSAIIMIRPEVRK